MAGLSRLCMRSMQQRLSSRGVMVIGTDHGSQGSSALRWSSNTANSDQSEEKSSGEIAVTNDQGRQKSKLARRRRRGSLWGNQKFGLRDLLPRSGFRDALWHWTDSLQRMVDEVLPGQLFGRVKESDKGYKLKLVVPGLTKEDLKITIEGGCLLIEGEHREEEDDTSSDDEHWGYTGRYGYYHTSLALPPDAKPEEIKAELKHGVLYITIPKAEEAEKKSGREIKIESNL